MALKATIFKAELHVADLDRGHFQDHALTLARHPSETDERMMVRLLAFALNAHDRLEFGRGLSSEDEPDLCLTDLTGAIRLWVDVGLPDERDLRKACGKSAQVTVYTYGSNAGTWWRQNVTALARLDNLAVVNVKQEASRSLAKLAQRSMKLQCTVQDGHVYLSGDADPVEIAPEVLKAVGA